MPKESDVNYFNNLLRNSKASKNDAPSTDLDANG